MLEYVYAHQSEVAECMAFGESDWAADRETRRPTTAVLEKLGKHGTESVSCSQTVTALSSDEAEFHFCREQRWVCCKHSKFRQAWDGLCERLCGVTSAAAIGISSRSSAGKLRHPRVKELWIQELVRARKLVIKKVGTDDNFADVGTKYIEDGKNVYLLSLSGLRMKRAWSGCGSIVHVEGAVTGSTAAVIVRVSLEMVITAATGCLGVWLLARWQVSHKSVLPRRTMTRRRNSDCSKGSFVATEAHWMLATSRPVEIMRWDRGNDRRAELLECHGGVTLWQAAMWVGALDDTDMCDMDVVIMRLLGMASTATAARRRVLWMRCVEGTELVKLGGVLEKSEASWAIAQFSSRAL